MTWSRSNDNTFTGQDLFIFDSNGYGPSHRVSQQITLIANFVKYLVRTKKLAYPNVRIGGSGNVGRLDCQRLTLKWIRKVMAASNPDLILEETEWRLLRR